MVGRRFQKKKILSGEDKQKERGLPALLLLHIPQHLLLLVSQCSKMYQCQPVKPYAKQSVVPNS